MHGCSSGSALLVNAEVDSMGGVVDGGVGIGLKTSPRRAAIEKAQAELRQEYDVREQRRRELEFLEKGGNPLDFKIGNGASVSVQSTSLTDQHPEQFVTSEAKGSFALTASPHGDSVESSGRPEVPTLCEPNSADNLLLFDGGSDAPEGEMNSVRLSRRNNKGPSEQFSQMDGTQNPKESEDSTMFRPYARRNRSRPNHDGPRSNSVDIQGRGGQGSSLPARGVSKDTKRPISETNNQRDQNIPSGANLKYASSNGDILPKIVTSDNQFDMDLEGVQAPDVITGPMKDGSQNKLDVTPLKSLRDSQRSEPSQIDAQETPIDVVSERSDVAERKLLASSVLECPPCAATTKTENEISSVQVNGFNNLNRESKSVPHEGQISSAALSTKGLDSESSCTQTSVGLDVNNDSDLCTTTRNADNRNIIESSDVDGTRNPAGGLMVQEDKETKAVDSGAIVNDNQASVCQNNSGNREIKVEGDTSESRSELHNEVKFHSNVEGEQPSDPFMSEADKVDEALDNSSNINRENFCTGISQGPQDSSMHEVSETAFSGRDTAAGSDCQTPGVYLKVIDKAHEDSILEEARVIEVKRKRIAELSVRSLPSENRRKSQWDFVLEEMAWLANDFAQERLWKLTTAAQICHRAAFASRLRIESQHHHWELTKVAHDLAKAVNQFWVSAETLLKGDDSSSCQKDCNYNLVESMRIERNETSKDKNGEPNMEPIKYLEPQHPRKDLSLSVQGYAVRFLKYNNSLGPGLQAPTPERISDLGITEMSWEDHLTEENLFYAVPSGAMETYRKSIESHLVQFERTVSSMQEEVETSMYDAGAEFGFQETAYDEDEGETSTYYLPGAFEGSRSLKSNQKKRRNLKLHASRSYEGADLPYGNCTTATQQSMSMGKRPASLNVGSIPTKRTRTASRQRVVSPFGAGPAGNVQAPNRTDASSGDTNSFQDDQSTLHGGSQFQKSMEVESVGDFEKQLPYDYAETSMKPKKKKAKHLGSTYDPGWQLDSAILNEQRDHSKKGLEGHHFESNGTIGLYGQHTAKKPKILKQSLDNTYDSITPMPGSNPSPVASQMSNMSNTSKFIKLIGGRDRGRKTKSLKMSAGQPGSGGPWSLFEDQALVVLVHDMGPNWELISDAINSTLHLKCIFRKPKECKERHKILMDMNSGDGADSAEDSGSSQPYPSTIPGIPKGSARQLFQRLQEPMEEDVLKSHFEKIIKIGQRHHYRRSQNDNQDLKQVTTVHNSHVMALSQVCPNNLNGGVLTPLDLCDTTSSSSDVLGYQGSHSSGLAMSNQGGMASLLPSGANVSIQGSSGMVLGSNLPSPSGSLSANVRDGRYGSPRTSSLPVDEQQKMQHYNQMLSGRNIQQSGLSVPGALPGTDRGVRIVPGGNGMSMMCGMNRGMPTSRPGFQGMTSPSMLNSGSMLSSSMVGIPSPVNMHSGAGSGQGNLMIRPRDALHMMRPGHNPEHQRQLMVPELQMQVTQGNGQGVTPFNMLSSGFPNQTTPPSAQTYPGHTHQQHQISPQQSHALSNPHNPHLQGPNHATGPQQQAYAIRVAKERLQQRYLHQQQQFSASNSLVPHVQTQAQLPMSSTLQNSSQLQSQTSPHPVPMSPMTPSSPRTPMSSQHQQKHHLPSHGLSRNPGASGMANQMGKQRQRQPQQHHLQQSGRHHPQQRQLTQSQQQAKLSKGMGRGNSMVHQNLSIDPIDPSQLNGLMPPGSQALEKGEQIMQLMQGQGAYSGSGLNPVTSKPLVPQSANHSQLQQKLLSSAPTPPSNQLQQMPSHSDNITQGQVPPVSSSHMISASHQTGSPSGMASNHQQVQPQSQPLPQQQQKQANQTQPYVQRVVQHNCQVNSEIPNKSQNDPTQADEQPVNGASQVGVSMVIPQSCTDSSSVVPSSEAVYDANMPNSTAQVGPIGSPAQTNTSGNVPGPPISQGLGPRKLSGNLLSHGHNVGAQWQQQQQLLQRSPSLPSPSQQQYQQQEQQQQQEQEPPQHQLTLQQQSQQQMQHLQAGQGSLYMMSGNSTPE
ncbi:hypothetical protein ACFX13_003938 [Malus domestica]